MFPFPRPLLMADTCSAITDAAVIFQLAEAADRAGFTSPLWMSYSLVLSRTLALRPKTVPLNVWHPLCGRVFYAAHPAHTSLNIQKLDVEGGTAANIHRRHVLSKVQHGQLEWTAVCPSVAAHLSSFRNGMASPTLWVPSELSRDVAVYYATQVSLPPFHTLVNFDQLEATRQLNDVLVSVYSQLE